MSPRIPSSRRRGGQPGNTNALKHGLTAKIHRAPLAKPAIPVPQKIDPAAVALSDDEETELLRVFFTTIVRLCPDTSQFIEAYPVFRKVINITFLQASSLRAQCPLTAQDIEGLDANFNQLMRLILDD